MSDFRKRGGTDQEKNLENIRTIDDVQQGEEPPRQQVADANSQYSHDEYDDYAPWDN